MSAPSSAPSAASSSATVTRTGAHSAELGARLSADLHQAIAQVRRLEPEYVELLADPDAIQEDRDAMRGLLEHARRAVDTARAALDRFEAGTYGLCVRCHRPIGAERLAALPDVGVCVSCQA